MFLFIIQCFLGSAAIDLAMTAAGQVDLYFQSGIHIWDFAAGALLVKEAGGIVIDPMTGGEFDLMSCRILVGSSQELVDQVLKSGVEFIKFPHEFNDVICPL